MILWIKLPEASRKRRKSLRSVMKMRIISIQMVKITPRMERRRTTLTTFAEGGFLETMRTYLKRGL